MKELTLKQMMELKAVHETAIKEIEEEIKKNNVHCVCYITMIIAIFIALQLQMIDAKEFVIGVSSAIFLAWLMLLFSFWKRKRRKKWIEKERGKILGQ
jgi:L-asparagine transporter-like permease